MVSFQRGSEKEQKMEVVILLVILDAPNVLSYLTSPPMDTSDKDANLSLRGFCDLV